MCKFTEYTNVTLGLFPVLNLNGEGADATISMVDGVSLIAERMSEPNAMGATEWAFNAIYHPNVLHSEFDRMESGISVQESVIVFNLDEFVFAFTHFIHNINKTTLADRLGLYALKIDNLTREDIRAMLLVHYMINE